MQALRLLQDMQQAPERFINPMDTIALGAFLRGYMEGDPVLWTSYRLLSDELRGTATTEAAKVIYLQEPDERKGVALLLSRLEQLLRVEENRVIPEDLRVMEAWAPGIMDGIRQGRPGMYLGEPSVMWLNNYVQGFHAGLRARNPAAAEAQEQELRQFEEWLQDWYETPHAAWFKILRVEGGADVQGLTKLVELWDRWKASTAPGAP
jgi:hypothetical protein